MYTGTPHYIATAEQLDNALAALSPSPFVAIDTEFLREKTYYAKFCLLQIASDDYCALIDVLALPTLAPLFDFLNSRERLKVMHAADQDLEVLAFANGALQGVPLAPIAGPFFDTQLAAAFMDMPSHVGYADLVQRLLDHTLDKGQTRTDWSQRPLSAAQLEYAAADVIYLAQLYHRFETLLGRTQRWQWLQDELQALENPARYGVDPAQAGDRLRGLDQLTGQQRAVARALAEWRELRAMKKDRPRTWILTDDALRTIAQSLPDNLDALGKIRGLPGGTVEKRGEELLTLIANAKARATSEGATPWQPPTQAQEKLMNKILEHVRHVAKQRHIAPERLITRREVEALVLHGKVGVFGSGWRYDLYGKWMIEQADHARELAARVADEQAKAKARPIGATYQKFLAIGEERRAARAAAAANGDAAPTSSSEPT